MLPLLTDRQVQDTPDALHRAWDAAASFAFISEKSGLSRAEQDRNLALLPDAFQRGHFILLTSGSTGQPKFVVGSKTRAEALARLLHTLQDAEPVRTAINALPLTYCYAFVNQWLWARVHQRTLQVTAGFGRPPELAEALQAAREAQLCLVRTHVPLLQSFFPDLRCPGVLRLHFAGSRFPQEQLDFLHGLFPNAVIYNNYGCTEAMPRLCLRRAEDAPTPDNVGRPLPGVELKTGETGELLFRSPFAAVGLIEDNRFHALEPDEWVGTGDLGRMDAEGLCWVSGRAAEVFKRHGEKVSLPLIRQTVSEIWKGESATYQEPDAQGEPGYVLVVSPEPTEIQVREVLQTLRQHHPRALWPIRLESVAELPRLPNDKIDSARLARLDGKKVHWYHRL